MIEEIEGVELVSVVGIPDENFGFLSAAAIKKKRGFEVFSEKFVIDYVKTKLSINKQLHGGVFFVEHLPQTASGKVQKRLVTNVVMNILNEKLN